MCRLCPRSPVWSKDRAVQHLTAQEGTLMTISNQECLFQIKALTSCVVMGKGPNGTRSEETPPIREDPACSKSWLSPEGFCCNKPVPPSKNNNPLPHLSLVWVSCGVQVTRLHQPSVPQNTTTAQSSPFLPWIFSPPCCSHQG